MNKYNRRVNTLYEKTHRFISRQDLSNMVNYYRWLVNKHGYEPEDLVSEVADFDKATDERSKVSQASTFELFSEIHKEKPVILDASLYYFAVSQCEEYPNGVWMKEDECEELFSMAEIARKHLDDKNKTKAA